MKGSFYYEEEFDEEILEYEITYTISKYYPGNYYNPPEGGDIEITSIKLNGVEVDVSEITLDRIITCAEDHAKNELYEDPYDYDREE